MLWCCASQPLHGNRGRTSHMKKSLLSSQHHPHWCDVTRTNIMRLFHCLWSSIVSVYYRYQAWQGSDCVPGTCVPSKTNTGSGLIYWMISIQMFFFLWWPVGGMVMKGLTEPSLFAALVFHISGGGTNKPEITVSVHKITGWADSPSTRMYQFARMYFRPIQCKVNPFILIIRQTNDKWQVLSKVMVQLFCFPISSIFHPSIKFHFYDIVCWWNSLCWHFLLPLALWIQLFLLLQAVYLAVYFFIKVLLFFSSKSISVYYRNLKSSAVPSCAELMSTTWSVKWVFFNFMIIK